MGIFFHKFPFADTLHWMKRKYIKKVLKYFIYSYHKLQLVSNLK
jgi:hypothetical protein